MEIKFIFLFNFINYHFLLLLKSDIFASHDLDISELH